MNRQQKRNALRFEILENRHMLSATADIVLFVDESGSLTGESQNVNSYEWFGDTITALEDRLVERGIGIGETTAEDDDVMENRYSVISFGTEVGNDWGWSGWKSTVDEAIAIFDTVEGGDDFSEDGIEPLFLATDSEDVDIRVDFDFRNNAAVHYVFITDGGTGENGASPFGPATENKISSIDEYKLATHGEILDVLLKSALIDLGNPDTENHVSDATITFLGGAGFDESFFPTFDTNGSHFGTEILGVDLNIDEDWVLHKREEIGGGWDADVYYEDGESTNGRVRVEDDFTTNADELSYEDIRAEFRDLVDVSEQGVSDWLDQDGYAGEIHALFAWESGGTYWDIDALNESNQVIYTDLMVKDMFDKIARQITDFDGDFHATDIFAVRGDVSERFGDGHDIDELFVKINSGVTSSEKPLFDLDGDDSVDLDDVILLVEMIYATWFGDADLDGDVDAGDLNIVGGNWQQEMLTWFEGDFNGDGKVDALDLNQLGQNWLNGTT